MTKVKLAVIALLLAALAWIMPRSFSSPYFSVHLPSSWRALVRSPEGVNLCHKSLFQLGPGSAIICQVYPNPKGLNVREWLDSQAKAGGDVFIPVRSDSPTVTLDGHPCLVQRSQEGCAYVLTTSSHAFMFQADYLGHEKECNDIISSIRIKD